MGWWTGPLVLRLPNTNVICEFPCLLHLPPTLWSGYLSVCLSLPSMYGCWFQITPGKFPTRLPTNRGKRGDQGDLKREDSACHCWFEDDVVSTRRQWAKEYEWLLEGENDSQLTTSKERVSQYYSHRNQNLPITWVGLDASSPLDPPDNNPNQLASWFGQSDLEERNHWTYADFSPTKCEIINLLCFKC